MIHDPNCDTIVFGGHAFPIPREPGRIEGVPPRELAVLVVCMAREIEILRERLDRIAPSVRAVLL